ncbi:hypothetical protein XpopCFBP1817_11405 [Xanthomonas populi]|uniref:Uncharacterized protein n=1 Tax=Xanthomonas populi TaxID=53414 RepID=A0A2S7ENG5_9XANT|nr:hypothetical protein XpopCFBP1817_11405 [Xanthomonas populi]
MKIEAGGLVSIAGLLEEDRGFLLGALIGIRETKSHPAWTPERYQAIKQLGDKELAAREASRNFHRSSEKRQCTAIYSTSLVNLATLNEVVLASYLLAKSLPSPLSSTGSIGSLKWATPLPKPSNELAPAGQP